MDILDCGYLGNGDIIKKTIAIKQQVMHGVSISIFIFDLDPF